jgi:hypothetical protein
MKRVLWGYYERTPRLGSFLREVNEQAVFCMLWSIASRVHCLLSDQRSDEMGSLITLDIRRISSS